ncbi:MAG: hypothetical protein AAF514_13260 [Verrucomicrobiota bacterium]
MIESLTLRLLPAPEVPPQEPEAWLYPHGSLPSLVEELSSWETPLEEIETYPLPRPGDQTAIGAYFLRSAAPPPPAGQSLPYHQTHPGLYLPIDALLAPPIQASEIETLFPYELTVFHPSIGPIGFDVTDQLDLSSCYAAPPLVTSSFNQARSGIEATERLQSVGAISPPALKLLARDAQEIGTRPIEELDPDPDQPTGRREWRQRTWKKILDKLSKAGEDLPGQGIHKTWMENLNDWALRNLDKIKKGQKEEIDRLLNLFSTNPDEALHYAIPVHSENKHRGLSQPQVGLTRQNPVFDLQNTRRNGGPASPWFLDWQQQQSLCAEYREAANRELAKGNHRRAAYIYAHLLKDYQEAANCLRQGGCYREAAVIYQKHLGQIMEAADCLAAGGFYSEAIPLFERKGEYLKAADLFSELGQEEESQRCLKLAVWHYVKHGQTVKAARLLADRLEEREEAITLLRSNWPNQSDAFACLMEEMQLYGEWDEQDRTRDRLREIASGATPEQATLLQTIFSEVIETDRSQEVREEAEDLGLCLAGQFLQQPDFQRKSALLRKLQHLTPGDELLRRDAARFGRQEDEREQQKFEKSQSVLQDQGSCLLPDCVSWSAFQGYGERGFCAAGFQENRLVVMRGIWASHHLQFGFLPGATLAPRKPLRLAMAHERKPELLSLLGTGAVGSGLLSRDHQFSNSLHIENPTWWEREEVIGMAYGPSGVSWVLQIAQNELSLLSYSALGDLIASHTVRLPPEERNQYWHPRKPLPMICVREQIYFAVGRSLGRFHRDEVRFQPLTDLPIDLLPTPTTTRLQVAAIYENGLEVFPGDSGFARRNGRFLAFDVEQACAGLTPSGNILLASRDRIELFVPEKEQFTPFATLALEGLEPTAILPTHHPDLFAICCPDRIQGEMTTSIYTVLATPICK